MELYLQKKLLSNNVSAYSKNASKRIFTKIDFVSKKTKKIKSPLYLGAVARIGKVTCSPRTSFAYNQQKNARPHVTPVHAPGSTAR